jgi:hypothetical protein
MNDHIKVHGCGCRFRQEECDHLCDKHKAEFILNIFNKDRNWRRNIKEWIEIAEDNS